MDNTATPGAAILTDGPKLLKYANESSVLFPRSGAGPNPPHLPSVSAIAETVITSGLLAGDVDEAS